VYQCQDGKWLSVAALEPQFYRNLWQALADSHAVAPEQVQPYLAVQWQRETWPAVQRTLAALFASRPRDEWCASFTDQDACVAPVLSLAEAQQHPHNLARRSFVEREGISQPAVAPRLSLAVAAAGNPPHSPAIPVLEALRNWGRV
jgi:alpha-methylacyl-CoA racemase